MKKINESFICQQCGTENHPLEGSCRNHCTNCLYSLHVDQNTPGDRLSECHALMAPSKIDQTGKKGWVIYHKCTKCDKIIPNKAAADDNFDLIIKLTVHQK